MLWVKFQGRSCLKSLERSLSGLVGGAVFAFTIANGWAAAPDATQQIDLNAGWNLISIQVGDAPVTTAAFQAALSHPEHLIEVWGYTPTGTPAVPGSWQTYQPTEPTFPSDLEELEQGRGYWVNVSQATTLTLTGVPWDGAVSLSAGWNLVGFPGVFLDQDEAQEISSVFGTQFGRIQQVWTYDTAVQRFSGYDTTAIPALRDLSVIEPGSGYWVFALEPVLVQPGPYLILPQDADASPLQEEELFQATDPRWLGSLADSYVNNQVRFRSADGEDDEFDLNGNGILDTVFTQDTIRFPAGVDRLVVSVGNLGSGVLNWVVDHSIPWLFTEAADEKAYPGNAGRPKTASGVVSSDRDNLVLYVDCRGLLPGELTATVTFYIGSEIRTVTVILETPTSSGDWKGYATAQRVNGKDIPLGKIDMALSLFMNSDAPTETAFRAVLNSDLSLLFPRDVFMNGVFYAGNDFSLTTNFLMPTGDRNVPPFDTFDPSIPNPRGDTDTDTNGDGIVDVLNPFPRDIKRELTLLGTRSTPDRMTGSYVEAIEGMLPNQQKVFIEGTFILDRQTAEPTKRSIFNRTDTPTRVIGGTSSPLFREQTISVDQAVNISGVTLSLGLVFANPAVLTVTLTSPTGQVVTIHRNGSTLPSATIDLGDFNSTSGLGDWVLRVEWSPTAERGYLNSWGLNIQGLATYGVTGTVVGNIDADPELELLEGAQIVLTGGNVPQQPQTDGAGQFSIAGLVENSYTLTISAPGFQSRSIPFFLSDADIDVGLLTGVDNGSGQIELQPVTVADAELRAFPAIGSAPLYSNFELIVPLSQLNAEVGANATATWDFDGSSGPLPPVSSAVSTEDTIKLTSAAHSFTSPGAYPVEVTLTGDTGSINRTVDVLVHRSAPDPAGEPYQLVVAGYVGAFASPLSNAGNPVQASGNIGYQESKRDVAAFDIDRDPQRADANDFHPNAEDTEFFTQVGTLFDTQSPDPEDGVYDVYAQPQQGGNTLIDRWRMVTTFGGYILSTTETLDADPFARRAPRVGDFVLQIGRVEP